MPQRLDEEELADWRAGRDALYRLAALTVGARLAVADALARVAPYWTGLAAGAPRPFPSVAPRLPKNRSDQPIVGG